MMRRIKLLAIGILISVFLFASGTGISRAKAAGGDVDIASTFPDEFFRQYVEEYIDTDKNGKLSSAEIAAVKEIRVSVYPCEGENSEFGEYLHYTGDYETGGAKISSLAGIEVFTSLKELYCSNNDLTELNVRYNTELEVLSCCNNKISSLDVSYNKKLVTLKCSANNLLLLNVSGNTYLEQLDCCANKLTALSVKDNTYLERLDCDFNKLSSLTLGEAQDLLYLYCFGNRLSNINVSTAKKLKELDCGNNRLDMLNISNNTYLTHLVCSNNKLTSLDVSRNTELNTLACSGNMIGSLNVSKNVNLTSISCGFNSFKQVDLSRNPNIVLFDFRDDTVSYILPSDLYVKYMYEEIYPPTVYERYDEELEIWIYEEYDDSDIESYNYYCYDNGVVICRHNLGDGTLDYDMNVIYGGCGCAIGGDGANGYWINEYGGNWGDEESFIGRDYGIQDFDEEHNYYEDIIRVFGNEPGFSCADSTAAPKITAQPADKSLLVGSTAKFTVEATGVGPLKYRWQYRKDGRSEWADSGQSGAKTSTLLVSATAGLHGYQFRCIVEDANEQVAFSGVGTLTLKPRITTQPVDKSLLVGSTAKFTVAATGKSKLTYQWQYRKNSSASWANSGQQGAKTDTLLVSTTAALHGYQFRCIVTDGNGQKSYSNAATLTLKPRITTQPVDKSLLVWSTAKFTVAATGKAKLTYQWQYRKNASSDWANSGQQGAKTDTLLVSATAGLHGYQFRCIVTDGNGQKTYSKTVTLTLKPRITTQPANKSVNAGSTAEFTVAATGKATLTYQWQFRKNSSAAWINSGQRGSKTATLSVASTDALNGNQFRCVVTDGNNQKSYSSTAILTVTSRLTITTQPKSVIVPVGTSVHFTIEVSGDGPFTYQWQAKDPATNTWKDSEAASATTNILYSKAKNALNGYQFRCIVKDVHGNQVTSNAVSVTAQ